jgi:DNA primase
MEARDDIKRRLSVEDVVSGYVELKRAGRNFKALSPFGNEKTPSFMVSPEKQIWHDFSSNKGGDIFTFVMEMEGVDFKGALEILARKAGLDLSQYQRGSGQTAKLKQRLYELLELSTRYYHKTLSKNARALNYLKQRRNYSVETISNFQLGYAPSRSLVLAEFLLKKGFSKQEIQGAGLISSKGWDMFRGRIMVPLMDGQGRPIGFTARLLEDSQDGPKYINTPQTLLYNKSRHVFGLHLAKTQIRQQDFTVLVEGNLDVIASHQANIRNCVATAGTALTRDQLVQLGRLSTNVKLAFDRDKAGIDAAIRSIPIAYETGINLSIVTIEGGKDPDELIRKDPKLWIKALDNSMYVMDWLTTHYEKEFDLSTAQGKREFSDKLVSIIFLLKDSVEQEHYTNLVAEKTKVSPDRIKSKLADLAKKPTATRLKIRKITEGEDKPVAQYSFIDTFFGIMIQYPNTRDALNKISLDLLTTQNQISVFNELSKKPGVELKHLKTDENYVKIVTFQAEELYGQRSSSERLADAFALARRIAKQNLETRKSKLTQAIRQAEDAGDSAMRDRLLKQFTQL